MDANGDLSPLSPRLLRSPSPGSSLLRGFFVLGGTVRIPTPVSYVDFSGALMRQAATFKYGQNVKSSACRQD
jgi:hypothetical protein